MPWVIKNMLEGPVIVNDLSLTFSARDQIRDVDLYGGRENAERSNDLKCLLFKNYLKEIRKDPPALPAGPVTDSHVNKIVELVQQNSDAHAQSIQRIEQKLDDHKQELSDHKQEMVDLSKKILDEVRAFAEKYPLEIRTIATAMQNIGTERAIIASQMAASPSPDESDADVQAQNRLLAMKDKKLVKNLNNLGKTVSISSEGDIDASLKALEEIGLPPK